MRRAPLSHPCQLTLRAGAYRAIGATAYTILAGKHPFNFDQYSRPVILQKVPLLSLPVLL